MLLLELKEGESIPIEEATEVKVVRIGWRKVKIAVATTPEPPLGQNVAAARSVEESDAETAGDDACFVYPVFF